MTYLYARTSATAKRAALRAGLKSGELLRLPGAFNPLTARIVQQTGFEGVYVSGGALSAAAGLPDIGLTTLTEVAGWAADIAASTDLPALVDADTGFGEPLNAARTVQRLEDAGLAGCHLEDQVNPKRCGHLDGKTLVTPQDMARRLRGAVAARRDPDFLIMARTDARAVEGLDGAIARAKAYVDAGADAIFPEALADAAEFAAFRAAVDVPLLANMTEFGKGPNLGVDQLRDLGYNLVIYPVTTLRLAMGAVEAGLRRLAADGTAAGLLDTMMTRSRLYEVIDYDQYGRFDGDVAAFTLPSDA
ncbi:methylisocitrate lyase [Micromonospora craniellae]|uniref:Methylisocitrate lyase n=1 Tax=Micromonospora craniellae TaxID=2294034 RepID=A0A372FTU5_9ACTN|nr:methylisocitrate lyase [Micromonospora craniellae]QOC92342.1 methylisocitrate lyase [Micromonospora craniellae]RFS44108.1 methylisocitrate lyase [Micromonospora craniellae]